MKCPCKECICLPMCRNRGLSQLYRECQLLDLYVERYSNRYKNKGIRLIRVEALNQINRIFKWGMYDYSM